MWHVILFSLVQISKKVQWLTLENEITYCPNLPSPKAEDILFSLH